MNVDEVIQLFRTTSLPRLRVELAVTEHIFYEKLITLLQRSQTIACQHRWETVGQNQRCLLCGKTLLIPKDEPSV